LYHFLFLFGFCLFNVKFFNGKWKMDNGKLFLVKNRDRDILLFGNHFTFSIFNFPFN